MRGLVGLLVAALMLPGCVRLPAEQAFGTPAARVASESMASIRANDVTVGAAVAVSETLVVTNAHVVRQAGRDLVLRRSDGAEVAAVAIRNARGGIDMAMLEVPRGFLRPAAIAEAGPRRGERVWAIGPEGLGRALASGPVVRPGASLDGFGRGFTARMGALMGFSGGPVVNAEGEVVGLTTAMLGAGQAGLMGMLTGVDVGGLVGTDGREVFVLALRGEAPSLRP